MSKTNRPITKGEAAEILQSALSYCHQAGLKITAQKLAPGKLTLFIDSLELVQDGDKSALVPTVPPAVPPRLPGRKARAQEKGPRLVRGLFLCGYVDKQKKLCFT